MSAAFLIFSSFSHLTLITALAACPCIGVTGATLGAGIGPLVGYRGLLSDALESVRIITANGTITMASAHENPSLFWALRGAGTNFGIVTSATYKVYDITNSGDTTVVDMQFPATANHSFYEVLNSLDKNLPKELGLTIWASYNHTQQQVSYPHFPLISVPPNKLTCRLDPH